MKGSRQGVEELINPVISLFILSSISIYTWLWEGPPPYCGINGIYLWPGLPNVIHIEWG